MSASHNSTYSSYLDLSPPHSRHSSPLPLHEKPSEVKPEAPPTFAFLPGVVNAPGPVVETIRRNLGYGSFSIEVDTPLSEAERKKNAADFVEHVRMRLAASDFDEEDWNQMKMAREARRVAEPQAQRQFIDDSRYKVNTLSPERMQYKTNVDNEFRQKVSDLVNLKIDN